VKELRPFFDDTGATAATYGAVTTLIVVEPVAEA
jgi:hypothetical protein